VLKETGTHTLLQIEKNVFMDDYEKLERQIEKQNKKLFSFFIILYVPPILSTGAWILWW
jgi:hypothetical protein